MAPGHPADLVALDQDPLGGGTEDTAHVAEPLRDMPVVLTMVGAHTVYDVRWSHAPRQPTAMRGC